MVAQEKILLSLSALYSPTDWESFIAIILGVILFFSIAGTEGKQDYFEGKVLENSDDYIVIKINSSYEKLIKTFPNRRTIG